MTSQSLTKATLGLVLNATIPAWAGQTLTTGAGDGTVTLTVDGYGAFGSTVGAEGSDATYDPVGPIIASGTVYQSAIALRLGSTGSRQFLGSVAGPSLPVVPVTGTSTTANSTFTALDVIRTTLTQSVAPIFDPVTLSRIGSSLTQRYAFTNTTNAPVSLEVVRYVDGDLQFNGTISDGGGRLVNNGVEFLFENDSATGALDPTTFIGISAAGGVAPVNGRFEIDSYSSLRARVADGIALDNIIAGDSNADGFVDAAAGYDITLALNNILSIPAGGTSVYTATTLFGSFRPADAPEPASLASLGLVAGFGLARRRRA